MSKSTTLFDIYLRTTLKDIIVTACPIFLLAVSKLHPPNRVLVKPSYLTGTCYLSTRPNMPNATHLHGNLLPFLHNLKLLMLILFAVRLNPRSHWQVWMEDKGLWLNSRDILAKILVVLSSRRSENTST